MLFFPKFSLLKPHPRPVPSASSGRKLAKRRRQAKIAERLEDRRLLSANALTDTSDDLAEASVEISAQTGAGSLAASDGLTLGDEFRVNQTTSLITAGASEVRAAMAADGSYIVVWTRQLPNWTVSILGRRYNPSGESQSDEFLLTDPTASAVRPSVASDANGNFVLAWWQLGQQNPGIFVRRFAPDGTPVGEVIPVATSEAPQVAAADDGRFVLVRFDEARLFDAFDQLISSQTFRPPETAQLSVAMDGDGNFAVVWVDYLSFEPVMWARRFDSQGQPVGDPIQVAANRPNVNLDPDVALGPHGDMVITWSQRKPISGPSVVVQHYRVDGTLLRGTVVVSDERSDHDGPPKVAFDDVGNYAVSWPAVVHGKESNDFDVFARRFDPTGIARSEPTLINQTTDGWHYNNDIAGAGNGSFVVVWEAEHRDNNTADYYGRRILVPQNQNPRIDSIADQSIDEHSTFSLPVTATDDLPNDNLAFSLVGVPPAGLTIDPTSGQMTWTPSEADGPQSHSITVRVTDAYGASDETSFNLAVTEINETPEIEPVDTKFVDVGQQLSFSIVATDPDLPQQSLTYSLAEGPAGATLDPTTGRFTWTPAEGQGGRSFTITTIVTDSLATNEITFTAHVAPPLQTFVQVVDGSLIVNGTERDDRVAINSTGMPGGYEIRGTLGTHVVNGVLGNIQVQLGAGNDHLRINNAHVPGNINLNLGRGQDALTLGDLGTVSTAQNLVIDLGDDGDELLMHRVFTRLDQTINAGPGADHLTIFGLSTNGQFWIANSSGGATTLLGGDGDDSIRVAYSVIVGYWAIDGGNGNDWISVRTSASSGGAAILGGLGYDLLQSEVNYIVASLTIDGGMDADHLMLNNSILLHSATITGGDGHDRIETVNNTARSLSLSGGAGLDRIDVRSSSLEQLFADLGDDNDALTLQWNVVHGLAQVDGGLGLSDQLLDPGNLFGGVYRKLRFETFA